MLSDLNEFLGDYCEGEVQAVFNGYFTDFKRKNDACVPCFLKLIKEYEVDVVGVIDNQHQTHDITGCIADRQG